MRHFPKYRFTAIGLFVLVATLPTGCAPITRESCLNDTAYDIGRAAALDNAERPTRLREVGKICGKAGREIDEAEFSQGFEVGLSVFCEPSNGYRWGRQGRAYNGICADTEFGMAYEDGFEAYRLEQKRNAIRDRLSEIRDRLSSTATKLDDKNLPDEDRRRLLAQQDRLLLERSDLRAELPR
jgi:hypothetical protein